MKKLTTFYRLAKEELDKVIFPIKEQIRSAHISVFTVVCVVTLFLALVNFILDAIVSRILWGLYGIRMVCNSDVFW